MTNQPWAYSHTQCTVDDSICYASFSERQDLKLVFIEAFKQSRGICKIFIKKKKITTTVENPDPCYIIACYIMYRETEKVTI